MVVLGLRFRDTFPDLLLLTAVVVVVLLCHPLWSFHERKWHEPNMKHDEWKVQFCVAAAAMLNIEMEAVKSLFWSRCQILKNCGCRVMDSYGKVLCFFSGTKPTPCIQQHILTSYVLFPAHVRFGIVDIVYKFCLLFNNVKGGKYLCPQI